MRTPLKAVVLQSLIAASTFGLAACFDSAEIPQAQLDASAHALSGGGIAFLTSAQRLGLCSTHTAAELGITDSTKNYVTSAGIYDWCIPEYHDDQRLSNGDVASAEYGPVAHTFAVPSLAKFLDHNQFDDKYVLVAIVDLDEAATGIAPYEALKLTSLHNCLYLKHHDFPRAKFTAVMEPGDPNSCPATVTESDQNRLDVDIEKFSDHETDYPPVSRFVEGNSGQTYIGVMCTNRWCVVGPRGFGGAPGSAHETAVTAAKQNKVKGWFDDQVIGKPGAGTHGIKRELRASMIPDPILGDISIAAYKTGFQHVADVYFPVAPAAGTKYVDKYGFSQGFNSVEMKAEDDAGSPGGVKWTARINGNNAKAFKVVRTDHSLWTNSVAATARFRWRDTDEDFWVACAIGCCLVNGDVY